MSHRRHSVHLLYLVLILVAATALPALPLAAQDEPPPTEPPPTEPPPTEPLPPPTAYEQAVDPVEGVAGNPFRFYATGFTPGATIAFWGTAPDGSIVPGATNRARANDDGRADWEWLAPVGAPVGDWQMVAYELDRSGDFIAETLRTIPFRIVAASPNEGLPPTATDRAVEPSSANAGSRFSFFAEGYEPREIVAFWFNAPDGTLVADERGFRVRVAENGRADWTWLSPQTAQPGRWQAVAVGEQSGVQRTIPFDILPVVGGGGGGDETPNPNPPDRGASPAVGIPDETMAFFAEGFRPRELVLFWANSPDGDVEGRNGNRVQANDDGRVDFFWRVPEDAVPGTWQMVAYGDRSETTRIILFEVGTRP